MRPADWTFGLAVLLHAALYLTALAQSQERTELKRFEFERGLMGTRFRIVAFAADSSYAATAAGMAFARVDSLNSHMSDYLPDSELSRLSATAGSGLSIPVSSDLWKVLVFAQELADQTDGAFDVSVGSLTRLWRHAMRRGVLPDPEAIDAALKSVGYQYVKLDSLSPNQAGAIRLENPGMQLDLGGIAKGYAVDEAFKILKDHGITSVLVDGGGDMRLGESPPGRAGWEIVVSTVDSIGRQTEETATLSGVAVATSGARYRFIEQGGVRYSHIVDPKTGIGLTIDREVTVVGPEAMAADALASALSVIGPEQGASLLARYPGTGARFVESGDVDFQMTDIPVKILIADQPSSR